MTATMITHGFKESTSGLLVCGVPESLMEGASDCKWPMTRVTTCHRLGGLNPLSDADEQRAWLTALKIWNDACGINLVWTDDFNAANIYASPGSMSSGILAWSYLPCGASSTSRMEQQYNYSVNWSFGLLVDTMIHEIGHALGLNHSSSNNDIMRPFSNGQMGKLGPGDIAEIQRRYGPPKPTNPNDPPTDTSIEARLNEVIAEQGRMKKLLDFIVGELSKP